MQSNDALPEEARLDEDMPHSAEPAETADETEGEETEGEAGSDGNGGGDADREEAFAAAVRMAEALLFAAAEPLDEATLRKRMPKTARVPAVLAALEDQYRNRGVNLKKVAGRWAFVTAPDLQHLLEEHRQVQRKLSRAAIETLAIIAYHQPCTRAEIEEIRGVSISKGTLDVLMETGWVKIRGRRRVPGRPVTYGTTDEFLVHFGLESVDALPGLEELRASGLLEALPASGGIPMPGETLDTAGEDPLDEDDDGREFLEPLIIEKDEKAAKDGDEDDDSEDESEEDDDEDESDDDDDDEGDDDADSDDEDDDESDDDDDDDEEDDGAEDEESDDEDDDESDDDDDDDEDESDDDESERH